MINNMPAMQETQVQSLGWDYPLEEGDGNPPQYSCLENSMDRGAWRVNSSWGHKESHMTDFHNNNRHRY